MLGGPVHAEEVDLRAKREDQVVVSLRLELAEAHLARVEVDLRHLVLVNPDVLLLVEEVADRMGDRGLVEQARRELIEQRLERVVVVPVHEHDVQIALAQLLGGSDSAEPSPEDHDARAAARVSSSVHHLRRYGPAIYRSVTRTG